MNAAATNAKKRYVFNVKLAKLVGLYQILDPNTAKIGGYNAMHVVLGLLAVIITLPSSLWPFGVYHLKNDTVTFVFYVGCVINFLFSAYKVAVLLYHSRDIWQCMEVASSEFTCNYRGYDADIFRRWTDRSVRLSYAYTAGAVLVFVSWASSPFVFNGTTVSTRNVAGTYSTYRLNIYNLYAMASEETYDSYYNVFFAVEVTVTCCFTYFTILFDVLVVLMSFSMMCQLETICDGIESLGHAAANPPDNCNSHYAIASFNDAIKSKKIYDIYNDLRMIIMDHQNVLKKVNDFNNIFRPVILSQIFVVSSSHIFVWFIVSMSLFEVDANNSILTIKLLTALPVFSFQLFMTCNLFGHMNEKKELMISALYNSNWTEMDLKSKKLILYAMKMTNANQVNFKLTHTKLVNLQMFTDTMRICYSAFSMLTNYKRKN